MQNKWHSNCNVKRMYYFVIKCIRSLIFGLSIVCIVNASVFGQSINLGLSGGGNLSSLKVPDSEYKMGYHYGVYARVLSSSKWGAQIDLTYNRHQTEYLGHLLKMNYVTVPLLIRYKFNPLLYLLVGPQYSFLAEQGKNTEFVEEGLRNTYLGVCFGVGVDLPMGFDMSLRVNNAFNELYTVDGGIPSDIVQLSLEMDLLRFKN
ncbi:porin family protein [Reichenbachiella versicolor]|uniref:porin family protein n=1 Tax=Reichenbachiella versicolor TaxID=1821036 RepID=UPI000D6E6A51|nr:porin family protein [Reichenbachiella versicolor]